MDHKARTEAVRLSLLLPDKPADRHNCYVIVKGERRVQNTLYPVAERRVQAVPVDPPTRPAA